LRKQIIRKMETRTIQETKIYTLVLNDMRSNTEQASVYAWSFDKEKLIDWYENHMITEGILVEEGAPSFECHGDSHKWHKTFNMGSVLEWCNPCGGFDPDHYGHGIHEKWITDISNIRTGLEEVN